MTFGILQNPQNHVDPGPVITANTLRRHHHSTILGVADMLYQLAVNGIHVGDQHNRYLAWSIQKTLAGLGLVPQRFQFTH